MAVTHSTCKQRRALRLVHAIFGSAPKGNPKLRLTRKIVDLAMSVAPRSVLWPRPTHSAIENEPTFLFVLTPPYSGSTVLAKVLNSGRNSAMLQEKGEGQWLVRGMCQSDRWEHEKRIDWTSVKAVWGVRIRMLEQLVGPIDVVIEKSPPNLVRADQLARHFTKSRQIAFIRSPFANCASRLYRNYDRIDATERDRIQLLQGLAESWIHRAAWLRRWIDSHAMYFFTYEQFCAEPNRCIGRVLDEFPMLKGIKMDRPFQVKDYPTQGIVNLNDRQQAKLTDREKDAIAESIAPYEDLLCYFGYSTKWRSPLEITQG